MLAHDVSGQSGSIIEQIAALKISNIAVGKQIAVRLSLMEPVHLRMWNLNLM